MAEQAATGLDEVLITEELSRRPSRAPDFEAENRALRQLNEAMAAEPANMLQCLAELALELTRSDSAGLCLQEGEGDVLRYVAVTGSATPPLHRIVKCEDSPCGEVLARNHVMLFDRAGRVFPEMLMPDATIHESLLAPFLVGEKPVGVLWVNKHAPEGRFEQEDARLLQNLAHFASAAHEVVKRLQDARQTAGQLKASRDLLQTTMDASTAMIQVFEAVRDETGEIVNFRLVLSNNSATDVGHEICGESILQRSLRARTNGTFETFKRITETGRTEHGEHHYTDEQFERWFFQSVVKLGDGVATTTKDITDWKRAQTDILRLQAQVADTRLRESEERYRSLFEAMDEGFCVIEKLDTQPGEPSDYHYVTVNPAFGRHTGLRNLVGRTIREVVPEIEDRILDRYDQVVATGMPVHFEDCIRSMDLWVEVSASPTPVPAQVAVLFSNVSTRKRIETALRESEARSRRLVEGIAQAIWEAEPDGSITADTPTWRAHTGQSFAKVSGYGWLDAVHPDDRAFAEREWQKAVSTGSDLNIEYRLWHAPSGKWRWSNERAMPLLDSDGSIEKWVGMNIDIDDRKRAEESLRQREERIRHFGEASQDVLCIRDVETMQWTYLTPAFETVYGMSRGEATAGDNYTTWLNLIVPEDRDLAADSIRRVKEGEQLDFQYRIKRPSDGQIRWLRNTDFPIREEDGQVRLIGGIVKDVTERRQAIEQLWESEDRQRFLLSLSDTLRPLAGGREITSAAAEALAQHLGVAQVGYVEVSPDGGSAQALAGWTNGKVPELLDGPVLLTTLGRLGKDLLDGKEVIVEDVLEDARTIGTSHPNAAGAGNARATACLPVVKRGRLVAYLFATHHEPRNWPERDIRLLREVAERTWAALERTRAEAKLRESAERQRLLVAELQHRVRNILTVVRSVYARTIEAEGSCEEISQHFIGRLDSLARTQVMVTQSASGLVDLENMIRDELLSVGAADNPAVTIEGPEVLLRPKEAEALGLAIHELTTNSLKYGALRASGGQLEVLWSLTGQRNNHRLGLKWLERGVPALSLRPVRYGFGSELINEALPYRLGAETTLEFRGGGVQCTISIPIHEGDAAE